MQPFPARPPRAPRLPLFVPVATDPPLLDCWSVDLSRTGIGLILASGPAAGPREGDRLELSFTLPGAGARIRAHGVVRWRHEAAAPAEPGTGLGLGVEFVGLDGADRAELARYLQDYRYHVGVAFAVGAERRLVELALGESTRLHYADSVADLREVAGRGDVAAVIACGDDDALLDAAAEQVRGLVRGRPWGHAAAAVDLAPRLLHLGRVSPERVIGLFNAGRLHRALTPPISAAELRRAVLQSCAEYGVHTEQRRAVHSLERALMQERALRRPESQVRRVISDHLVYRGAAMEEVMQLVRRVAPHPIGVLLQGETGTGKEILARTIHDLSERADGAFVIQDCGALPETLLESELFGHVKGAFTGATADHPGLFVLADGGTIFLDEIENTTPNLQIRLLRVLETGAVRPVGGTGIRHVDVRVVAASNRDLAVEVEAGRFRADLYYRLNTFVVDVPPLRERREDIALLAGHFLSSAGRKLGREVAGLSDDAEAVLLSHDWPGNVRELKNVIERAVLLADHGGHIEPAQLPPKLQRRDHPGRGGRPGPLRDHVADAEREVVAAALARHGGVLRRAARELGVSPVTLGRKVRRLGLNRGS